MIDVKIKIDDKQIMDFCKKSPKRAQWAMSEALKMAGGHYRKKMRAFIEGGGENWAPLAHITKGLKSNPSSLNVNKTPLYGMGRFVRFKYGKRKGTPRVQIGFFNSFFKGIQRLARLVQYGQKRRVTPALRRFFAWRGIFLRKTTKVITVPPRPIMDPFWRKYSKEMLIYVEKKFFEKFFSRQRSKIGF